MIPFDLAELGLTLFEESGDALFLFDPDTEQLLEVNPMALRLCGFPRAELLRRPVSYLFRAEAQGGLQRLRHACKHTGVFHSQEGFLLRHQKEGVWVPVNLTVTRLHAEPRTLGLITARDVRERREAETLLQSKEAELRRVIASVSDSLWSAEIDAAGRWTFHYISPVVERITGRPPDYYYGGPRRWVHTVHPEDRPRVEGFANGLRAGRSVRDEEYRILTPAGEVRWVRDSVLVHRGPDGRSLRLDGVLSDVTERRRSEVQYRSLLENLEQCIFLKNAELRFVAVNRPFCQSLDRPESAILGQTDFEFYPPHLAEKYRADDRVVLTEGRRLELEEQNLTGDRLRTVRVVKTPMKDEEGRAVGILGIFWDVTEQRALEAQLRQAQKMEAVGQLAGGVGHDFNNLLTVILGNVSLVASSFPPGDPNRALIQAAEQAALRAAAVTRQMLGFARCMGLRTQPVSLNQVLDEVVALLRSSLDPRIRLEVHKAPDLGVVQADPGQMNQVLMNLALNARDALPEGGSLVIETGNVTLGEDYARRHLEARPGEFVRLRVRDTGHGIPPDVLPRIFDPFFTTKEPGKGTGLGLAVVFGIVKSHQGWIDCASEVGRGTSFDVYLPRSSVGAAAEGPAGAAEAPQGGRETVLLVDDEAMVRDLGRSVLQRYGYRVLLAEDGARAVEVYRQEHHRINLVVLDLTMPGLSGRDAFRQMLQLNPAAPVLFASGYSAEQALETDRERGLGFLGKPYRPEELALAVRAALDRAHARSSGQGAPAPTAPS
jgi:PAS domain S-box-containing protein